MRLHLPKLSSNTYIEETSKQIPSPLDEPPSYDYSISSTSSSNSIYPSTSNPASPTTKESGNNRLRLNSSSNLATKSKTNSAYVPSKEQQKQIELLNKSSTVTPISATTSNTTTEYFDVLPSFQMFQSILKRNDSQFSENLSINPPRYGDTLNSSPTPPNGLSSVSYTANENNLDSLLYNVNQSRNGQELNENPSNEEHTERDDYIFGDDEEHDGPRSSNTPDDSQAHNQNISLTHNSYGHSVLDNIDRLPKLHSSPIDIQIYVTKRVPQPNFPSELETRLKEYTSGDIVNGYIIITNTSDEPVDFGLFTVTLEGTIKAVEKNPNAGVFDALKYNKILMKKFLKMYDLNASYGYAHIPNSAGIEYEAFAVDLNDGCQIGLPNERILQPNTKYKKFFTFKFPPKLLDNNCIHNVLPHILPPPSMGLDKTCFYNRGQTIQMNKALGYGFLNVRGTPLSTKDYSFEDVSVSYTIEAKFIDKLNAKTQKDPLSQHEINDPNSKSDYVISKSNQYFLRFIPDIKEQLEYFNQEFQYCGETYGTVGIDGKLFSNYIQLTTWRAINELNYQLEKEIDSRLTKEELKDEDVKHKNLIIANHEMTNINLHNLNVKDQINHQLNSNRYINYNEELYYRDERMIGNQIPVEIYGKKKKKILSSLVKLGESKLYVRVPNKVIPYSSPKLLMKYNNGTIEEDTLSPASSASNVGQPISAVTSNEDMSLRPISSMSSMVSNINEIYNRNEAELLTSLDLSLIFTPTENSIKPPQVSYIETNIVFWSYKAEYPLPIELNYDFFYTDPKEHKTQNDDVEITRNNLQHLKDQVYNYIYFLKTNKTFISRNSYFYLKSIKTLSIKKDIIKDYYKTITSQSNPDLLNNDSGWKVELLPDKELRWVKNFSIPLTAINKGNVNLIPTFQSCLVGRLYCLQVVVKYKGSGGDQNEFADNIVKVDIPILVG